MLWLCIAYGIIYMIAERSVVDWVVRVILYDRLGFVSMAWLPSLKNMSLIICIWAKVEGQSRGHIRNRKMIPASNAWMYDSCARTYMYV